MGATTDVWRTPPHVRKGYVRLGARQLHFRANRLGGKATLPLLCLHPAPLSGRVFATLLEALDGKVPAVAPDLPGYGLSDRPDGPPAIADYVAHIEAFLDATNWSSLAVFGALTGAKVAVELARRRPDQVKALILAGATLRSDEPKDLAFGPVALAEDGSHYDAFWRELSRAPGRSLSLVQRDLSEAFLSYPNHWWGYTAARDYDLERILPGLETPTLILVYASPLRDLVKRAAALVPGAVMHESGDWDAAYLETSAPAAAEVIVRFLADKGRGPAPAIDEPARRPAAGEVRRAYGDGPYGQIHYRIGEPLEPLHTPLLCIHASPQSGVVYERLLADMSRDRIAVAPDTPGFGESEAPPAEPEIEDFARAAAGFLDSLGIQTTDVFGFHTGSMTAIELARQRPDLVRHVAMISAPVFTDDELADLRAHYKAQIYVADGTHNRKLWQSFWRWRGPGQPIENFARNNAQTLRAGPRRHWGHRAAFNYPLGPRLSEVDNPILVLNPNDDLVAQTRRAAPLIRNGRIHDLPHLGHGMLDVATAEIAALLREFFDAPDL